MRVDDGVLKDKRVRQAIALTLNRPQIVKTLFNGLADLGNDSPFAPVYPSTGKVAAAPQGHRQGQAADRGRRPRPRASRRSSSTYQTASCRSSRRSSSRRSRRSAATSSVKILTGTQYYSGTPTTTPWLNDPMTITDWGHRGVPNVLLNAALTSKADPEQEGRHLERGALQEQEVRRAREVVRRGRRARRSAEVREADRAAPARPDAGDLPLLLQLAQRGQHEGPGLHRSTSSARST